MLLLNGTILRLFNMGLRLGSLGAKMLLSLYMARYFSLADMGTYGLVAAYVAIAIPLLGMRLDFVVAREIVDASPFDIARKMRDEAVFYGLNYLLLVGLVLAFLVGVPHEISTSIVLITLALAVLESFCTITSTNFIFLKRPVLSNILFFIRAAAWTVPVIGLGLYSPNWQTLEIIFSWWLAGTAFSLLLTAFMFRHLPWREVFAAKVDWLKMKRDVIKCIPIWIGSVGGIAAINIDRFVVEYYLTRDLVGVISFYSSFAMAIIALIASGVSVFKQPHLIALHKQGDHAGFKKVATEMTMQGLLAATGLCAMVGVVVPYLGTLLGKPEIAAHAIVLWLMLFGVWLKMASDGLASIIYARHQDTAIWQGNLLMLAVSLGLNAALVPLCGLVGVGYSAIASGVLTVLWRVYAVKSWKPAA